MNQGELLWSGVNIVILMGTLVTAWAVLTGKSQKRDLGPQPFSVALEKEPLTVNAHKELFGPLDQRVGVLESDVRMIRHKMEADKQEIIQAGEERLHEIRADIREVRKDMSAQPAQIVALLKNTKGLLE